MIYIIRVPLDFLLQRNGRCMMFHRVLEACLTTGDPFQQVKESSALVVPGSEKTATLRLPPLDHWRLVSQHAAGLVPTTPLTKPEGSSAQLELPVQKISVNGKQINSDSPKSSTDLQSTWVDPAIKRAESRKEEGKWSSK